MAMNANRRVGIEELDAKHLELFEHLDLYAQSLRMAESRERLVQQLTDLQQSVIACFAYEEKLMREHKHPKFFDHRKQHRVFIELMRSTIAEVEGSLYGVVNPQYHRTLTRWLEKHIKSHDKSMAAHCIAAT